MEERHVLNDIFIISYNVILKTTYSHKYEHTHTHRPDTHILSMQRGLEQMVHREGAVKWERLALVFP